MSPDETHKTKLAGSLVLDELLDTAYQQMVVEGKEGRETGEHGRHRELVVEVEGGQL